MDRLILWTPWLLALLGGLALGSFANVLIHRLPRGASLLRPPSSCPACGRRIRPWENLPLLSWLLLRGRCAGCAAPISLRYPLVEALSGALAVAVAWQTGLAWSWLALLPFFSLLLALAWIDWETMRLPDALTGAIGAIGLTAAGLQWWLGPASGLPAPLDALLGGLVGGGTLWAIAWIGWWLLKRESMGGGDIKLMAAAGLFLGWDKTLLALFLGSVGGAVYGILQKGGRYQERPFGPWLALGCAFAWFVGDRLIALYLGWAIGL